MSDRRIASRGSAIRTAYLTVAAFLLAAYVCLYIFVPFEESLNSVILTWMGVAASLFAAVFAAVVYAEYQPSDQPRKMWGGFMLGALLWFAAEVAWAFSYINLGEVPSPSLADLGWLAGYPVFSIAIYYQLVLLQPDRRDFFAKLILIIWAILLIVPGAALLVVGDFHFGNYISYFYPLADLALGVSGLLFVRLLRGSMLARPWVGMIFFAVSDIFYAASVHTGIYDWSVSNNIIISLFVDTNYVFAYFLMALGFLESWVLIRFGLSPSE